MLEDYLTRIGAASEALADSIRVYSAALSAFGSEVEVFCTAGLIKDRPTLQKLVAAIDSPLGTIISHKSHLENLHASLQRTKNHLNPVNSLHPELLARIFTMVIYDNEPFPNGDDVFGSYPDDSLNVGMPTKYISLKKTLALSSVCGYWRHITLGIATLWSYIPIHLTGRSTQRSLDVTHAWLDRARTTPLDVSLYVDESGDTTPPRNILNNFLNSPILSKQIRALRLSLARTTNLNALLGKFGNDVPATLTKLRVGVHKIDESSTVQDWLPRCKELQILQLSFDALRDDHFSTLPKLVELELFRLAPATLALTVERLTNVLHACPSLQRLMLKSVPLDNTTNTNLAPVPLAHLNTLIIQHTDTTIVLPLVSSKSSSLSLTILDYSLELSDDNSIDVIRIFSQRTTVTALHLGVRDFGSDLHRILHFFPHLKTLSLVGIELDDLTAGSFQGTNELVAESENAPSVYPALQAIWLNASRIESEEALRTLIRLCPLKQLILDHCTFDSFGSILEAEAFHKYLLSAISDLIILE